MPIAALPANTVRAIGSTQVLTDSASVVKELVDNALDAHATSIFIEISVNTLDVIQVKDNGHGIAPDDRDMVCKRYCTSKIRDLDDLSNVGGSSLGFRGEALASAAEMSGGMVVTTRVDGEPVATSLNFNRQGGLISQQNVSHPVGTTVRVIDFLKHLPVRKQTALKTSSKVTTKIKAVLHAYALARPSVRISFKVLKARNDKANWTYAPSGGGKVVDAATKIIGQFTVSQCQWKSWTSIPKPGSSADESDLPIPTKQNTGYVVDAFLPRADSDLYSLNSAGQYISIDSRPVSSARGTLKQVVMMYKKYLRSACSANASVEVVNPFLAMNVVCPPASYDANIEPAKDDVLFADVDRFLEALKLFFESVYGELRPVADNLTNPQCAQTQHGYRNPEVERHLPSKSIPSPLSSSPRTDQSASEQPLAADLNGVLANRGTRRATIEPISGPENVDNMLDDGDCATSGRGEIFFAQPNDTAVHNKGQGGKGWARNMYTVFDDLDVQGCGTQLDDPIAMEDEGDALRHANLSNPWTIARINASVGPKRSQAEPHAMDNPQSDIQLPSPTSSRELRSTIDLPRPIDSTAISRPANALATPAPSSPTRTRPNVLSSSPVMPLFSSTQIEMRHRIPLPTKALYPDLGVDQDLAPSQAPQRVQRPSIDSVPARSLQMGTPLDAIPDISQKPRNSQQRKKLQQSFVNLPFSPPATNFQYSVSPLRGSNSQDLRPNRSSPQLRREVRSFNSSLQDRLSMTEEVMDRSEATINPDLAFTMDYETRKQMATRDRNMKLRQQTLEEASRRTGKHAIASSASHNSPHANRYRQAVAALSPQTSPSKAPLPIFGPDDPRGHLIRMQNTETNDNQNESKMQPPRAKRRKTSNMPLESVRREHMLQDLTTTIKITEQEVWNSVKILANYDEYIKTREVEEDDMESMVVMTKNWETTLRELLKTKYQNEGNCIDDIAIDLMAALQQ